MRRVKRLERAPEGHEAMPVRWGRTKDTRELRFRDDEVMPELLERMAMGQSVLEVCQVRGWNRATINVWCHSQKWRQRYLEAREALGAFQGERVIAEAEKAARERDHGRIAGLRVLVDALKWAASKHNPRVYGDRVDVTSDGRALGGVIALPAERVDGTLGAAVRAVAAGEAQVFLPGQEVMAEEVREAEEATDTLGSEERADG